MGGAGGVEVLGGWAGKRGGSRVHGTGGPVSRWGGEGEWCLRMGLRMGKGWLRRHFMAEGGEWGAEKGIVGRRVLGGQ